MLTLSRLHEYTSFFFNLNQLVCVVVEALSVVTISLFTMLQYTFVQRSKAMTFYFFYPVLKQFGKSV